MNNTVNAPKFYYAIYILAGIFFLFHFTGILRFITSPLILWTLIVAAMFFINYLRTEGHVTDQSLAANELDRFERISMLVAIAYCCIHIRESLFKTFLPIAAIIVFLSITVDFLFPGSLNATYVAQISGRADGFFMNPNPAAEASILSLAISGYRLKSKALLFLYLLCGVAVLLTFSRSGMAMWLFLGILYALNGKIPKSAIVLPILFLVSVNLLQKPIENFVRSIPEYEYAVDNLLGRIMYFKQDIGTLATDASEDSRTDLGSMALQSALNKPLFGHGFAFYSQQSQEGAHNLFLLFFHLNGIFGIIAWLTIILILWKSDPSNRILGKITAFVFFWFSLFSHNIFDYPFWMLFLSIMVFAHPRINALKYYSAETFYNSNTKISVKTTGLTHLFGKRRKRKAKRRTTPRFYS